MKLLELLLEITSDEMLNGWLNKGLITNEDIDLINKVTTNQNYRKWLGNLVKNKILKSEEILKFKDYLDLFTKYPNTYSIKDVNLIKNSDDLNKFMSTSVDIMNSINLSNDNTKNHINPNKIKKLSEVGIIDMKRIIDGYQLFKIPMKLSGNEDAYKTYREILGKCSGGEINICTIGSFDYFNDYLRRGDLYVLFNYSDSRSPYQIHVESASFLDSKNSNVGMGFAKKYEILKIINLYDSFINSTLKKIIDKESTLGKYGLQLSDLTPEQQNEYKNRIIKYDKRLDYYGLKLSDLTPEQQYVYINKALTQIQHGYSLDYYGLQLSDLTPEQQNRYINGINGTFKKIIKGRGTLINNGLKLSDFTPQQQYEIVNTITDRMFEYGDMLGDYGVQLSDLTPEMKNLYINKIIKSGGIINHYGLKLSDLTPEQKNEYIPQIIPQIIQYGHTLKDYGLQLSDLTPQQQKLIQ